MFYQLGANIQVGVSPYNQVNSSRFVIDRVTVLMMSISSETNPYEAHDAKPFLFCINLPHRDFTAIRTKKSEATRSLTN
jgi:hypothetical protein